MNIVGKQLIPVRRGEAVAQVDHRTAVRVSAAGSVFRFAAKPAADVAQIVLTEFDIEKVRVRIEKPGALRFAESVGIEIVRSRMDIEL